MMAVSLHNRTLLKMFTDEELERRKVGGKKAYGYWGGLRHGR